MLRCLILLVIFSCSDALFSQKPARWGKVSKAEQELIFCNFDSTAPAAILSDVGRIEFIRNFASIKIHTRLKIFNENGYDYATVTIPFYHANGIDNIKFLEAHTLNSVNGSITRIPVESSNIYTRVINKNWSQIEFTFPAARAGSILEYRYTLDTRNFYFLKSWFFQNELPTMYSEISMNPPEELKYSLLTSGTRLRSKYDNDQSGSNCFILTNIPGYREENFVYCYKDYAERLDFQLLEYELYERRFVYQNLETVEVLNTWEKLALESWEEFKPFLDKDEKVQDLVKTLTAGLDSQEDKIRTIYAYVQKEISWDRYYSIHIIQSLRDFINTRTGNSCEINLYLCMLLREAGIPANPMLISTRSHGKMIRNYPYRDQFNHVVVAYGSNKYYRIIDAVQPSGPYNLPPLEDQNYFGFLINGKTGSWISPETKTESRATHLFKVRFNDSLVSLALDEKFSGYFKAAKLREVSEDKLTQPGSIPFFSNMELQTDSVTYSDPANVYDDFRIRAGFSGHHTSPPSTYFLALSNLTGIKNEFTQSSRQFPVELPFPSSQSWVITVDVPENYTVEDLPENLLLELPNKTARFNYTARFEEGKLTVLVKLNIDSTLYPVDYYDHLREFYHQISRILARTITLSRNK